MKTLKTAILAATLSTAAIGVAPVAMADVSASATVSTSYLWRGYDLGSGTPAFSADLVYSHESGFYGGLWISSGDRDLVTASTGTTSTSTSTSTSTTVATNIAEVVDDPATTEVDETAAAVDAIDNINTVTATDTTTGSTSTTTVSATDGTEYDLFIGYAGSVGEVTYDIGYATYSYPTAGSTHDQPGSLAEYIYSVGYGPASVTVFDDTKSSYTYTAVGYDAGDFSFTYGEHDGGADNQSNLDISYAVNDSLSLTMSTVLDSDDTSDDAETTFVASYSLAF